MQRVAENGRPAGKPLLQHEIVTAQRLLQKAGPALILVEAVGAIGGVVGVCAVAVGV